MVVDRTISIDQELSKMKSKEESLAKLCLEVLANSDIYLKLPNGSDAYDHNLRVTRAGNEDNILSFYIEPDSEEDRFILEENENQKPYYKTDSRRYDSNDDIVFYLKADSRQSRNITPSEIILCIAPKLREDREITPPITSIISYHTFRQMQYEAKLPLPNKKPAFLS